MTVRTCVQGLRRASAREAPCSFSFIPSDWCSGRELCSSPSAQTCHETTSAQSGEGRKQAQGGGMGRTGTCLSGADLSLCDLRDVSKGQGKEHFLGSAFSARWQGRVSVSVCRQQGEEGTLSVEGKQERKKGKKAVQLFWALTLTSRHQRSSLLH